MQEVFPCLKEHGGKVVNFGSMAGEYGLANHGSYSITKEGLLGLTRTAALEWGQYNIQVNAICPFAASDQWWDFEKGQSPEAVKAVLRSIPLGRIGDAEKDIGRVVVFLASEDSNWITSRTIFVDGGQGAIR